jgi:hypothetical protein
MDGLTTQKIKPVDMVNAVRPFASQAEAEAGTVPDKDMSPLTTRQAIDGRLPSSTAGRSLLNAADDAAQRGLLGLGGAALVNIGTTAGTAAAGDDSRITGAAQKSANLSDLASASTARTNLGLGAAAVLGVGSTAGTVAAGDDIRFAGVAGIVDQATAEAGTNNTGIMSPLRSEQFLTARYANQATAEAASSLTTLMSPGRTAQLIDARSINPTVSIPASVSVHGYTASDAFGRSPHFLQSNISTDLSALERYTLYVGNYSSGTGDGTVPGSTYALGLSMIKTNWPTSTRKGQMHGLQIIHRSGFHGTDDEPGPDTGTPGDSAAIVTNGVVSDGNSFCAILEGGSHYMPGGAGTPGSVKAIRVQIGAIAHVQDIAHGIIVNATAGPLKSAFFASSINDGPYGDGSWENFLNYVPDLGAGPYEAFKVNQSGWLIMNNGPLGSPSGSTFTLRAGSAGGAEFLNHAQTIVTASLSNTGNLGVAQSVDLTPMAVAPPLKQGRMYQNGVNGKLMFCEDGASWKAVTTT